MTGSLLTPELQVAGMRATGISGIFAMCYSLVFSRRLLEER
jgi:hypothetical protein